MSIAAAADRNLLLGIIALQVDFISRDALIAAMHAWVSNKAVALSQILQDQGALSAARRSMLDALVEEHIHLHDDDPQKSLAAVSTIGSVMEDLSRIADADLQASLPQISAARRDREDDPYRTIPPASVGDSTSPGLRFRILRPHAKGGLGQVSVALDRELDRRVALKEIQDRHADDLHSRARFVQEAEITGKLEHPGIIPVYGLGHDASGRPFYAMRFIEGDSLREAITAFHRDIGPKQDMDARGARLRDLLRRFTDVCNAVAYAHSRGVLHRDLKPGNIMLGPYGETLVVDWGLAKAVGTAPDEPPSSDGSTLTEGPIRLSGLSGSRSETVAGSMVGTPAYASPEQMAGRLDLLSPASDVYGLGATLYALLTGRDPVEVREVRERLAREAAKDLERPAGAEVDNGLVLAEVLRRVQKGEIPPPRSIDPTIPRPLEMICRKAMALQPEDRYDSARALAEDVTRWLDDAPVSAYQEPLSDRAGRWIRRHQRLVSSAAAAVLVGLVALGTAYLHESGINRQLKVARVKDKIANAFERFDGSNSQVDFLAGMIEELARLAPGEVARQRNSLGEHLVIAAGKLIRQERSLLPADVDRIGGVLGRVKEYAPKSVPDLEVALRERLSKLEPVFTLAGSFDGLPSVFEPGSVQFSGPGLVAGRIDDAQGDPLIRTKVPCQGDVEIEGTFNLTPGAIGGARFGLALNATGNRGYFFTLSSERPPGSGPAAGQSPSERLIMTIQRNKIVLRRTEVEVRGPTVRVFAQKNGEKLSFTFEDNQADPVPPGDAQRSGEKPSFTIGRTVLGFDDIFPPSATDPGAFGVVLCEGVRLDSLVARKQQVPPMPSRLEKGDAHYAQGMYAKAMEEFDRVDDESDQPELKAEAEYKKALCLLELKRVPEAKPIFERLAADRGPWQTRATCQVWRILLKSAHPTPADIQQADQIFDTLRASVDYADLAAVVSEEERDELLAYYRQAGHYARINWTPMRVRNLERAVTIEDLIKADRVIRQRTLWRLVDAYRLDGRDRDAVDLIEKLLANQDLLIDDRIGITRDYASMMIVGGTPAKALDEISRQLGNAEPARDDPKLPMILDRARVYAALKNWKPAETDVARFIETVPKPSIAYNDFAEACLFQGFLLERRGQPDEALKVWRAGLRKNWPKGLPVLAPPVRLLDGKPLRDNARSLLHFVMLASLTGELGTEETATIVTESMGSGDFTQSPIVKFFDFFRNNELLSPDHLRAIALSIYNAPIAREFARRDAYLETTLKEEFSIPLLVAVEAEIRLNAISEGDAPDLARLIHEGLAEINRAHQEARFTDSQFMKMLGGWIGLSGSFGWDGLETSLKGQPALRGKIAYVYGRRFLVLKQPKIARRLFQLTKSDLPPQSPFQRLAQDQLDKLGAE